MLNLGTQTIEDNNVLLEDVLTDYIELEQAYQDYINYKNLCEIVVKSKVSQECIDFASKLVGQDIKAIKVSAEGLVGRLKYAWFAFVKWAKRAISWIKYNVLKYTFKKDSDIAAANIVVSPTIPHLKEGNKVISQAIKLILTSDVKDAENIMSTCSTLSEPMKETTTLKSRSEIVEWVRLAEEMIYSIEKLGKAITSVAKDNMVVEIISDVFKYTCSAIKNGIKSVIAQAKGKAPAKKEQDEN